MVFADGNAVVAAMHEKAPFLREASSASLPKLAFALPDLVMRRSHSNSNNAGPASRLGSGNA